MSRARRRAVACFCTLLASATIASPASAAGPGRAECRTVPSKILGHPVAYCVILPSNYDTDKTADYPVLYFLHGLGGNEQLLLNSGGMDLIQDLRDQKKIGEFLVVAPNGGRSFYINSRDGKVRYEDFFIQEFVPYIESHYRIRATRKTRCITGVSMGGYGALHLALRHPSLFSAVSAHSPALIEKLPKMQGSDQQATAVAMILGGAFGSPIDPRSGNAKARSRLCEPVRVPQDCRFISIAARTMNTASTGERSNSTTFSMRAESPMNFTSTQAGTTGVISPITCLHRWRSIPAPGG